MTNASNLVERAQELEKAAKRLKKLARACVQAPTLKDDAVAQRDGLENALASARSDAAVAISELNDASTILGDAMHAANVPGAD